MSKISWDEKSQGQKSQGVSYLRGKNLGGQKSQKGQKSQIFFEIFDP